MTFGVFKIYQTNYNGKEQLKYIECLIYYRRGRLSSLINAKSWPGLDVSLKLICQECVTFLFPRWSPKLVGLVFSPSLLRLIHMRKAHNPLIIYNVNIYIYTLLFRNYNIFIIPIPYLSTIKQYRFLQPENFTRQ